MYMGVNRGQAVGQISPAEEEHNYETMQTMNMEEANKPKESPKSRWIIVINIFYIFFAVTALTVGIIAIVVTTKSKQIESDINDDAGITKAQLLALVSNQQEQLKLLTVDFLEVKEKLSEIRISSSASMNGTSGVNYIRWGRTECSETADKLYQGYVAKSQHNGTGGGADYICLHSDPLWPLNEAAVGHSDIHAVQYKLKAADLLNHNAPCVACIVTGRSQKIMIPGRATCSDGWKQEYHGVLVAEAHTKSTYVCLDRNPESIPSSVADQRDSHFYPVRPNPSATFSPPYTHDKEHACAVCTK